MPRVKHYHHIAYSYANGAPVDGVPEHIQPKFFFQDDVFYGEDAEQKAIEAAAKFPYMHMVVLCYTTHGKDNS